MYFVVFTTQLCRRQHGVKIIMQTDAERRRFEFGVVFNDVKLRVQDKLSRSTLLIEMRIHLPIDVTVRLIMVSF